MEFLQFFQSYVELNLTSFIIPLLILSYLFYYKQFRFYKFIQSENGHGDPKRPRGLCPPYFPNGWYRLFCSNDLKAGDVRKIDCVGRNVVLFRGTDNKAYVLDAYCSHMGANLGVGGKVKHTNCIECPFHGWMYEGSSGKAILDSDHTARHSEFYEYNNGVHDPQKNENGEYLKKCGEGETFLKKYEVREINGFIMVWFHCKEEYRSKPLFEPLDYDLDLQWRGESVQYVNCHVQEIPENGADIRHFDYVHLEPINGSVNFSRFRWTMKTKAAKDSDLKEYIKHDKKYVNDYSWDKINKYITEENKNYANVISLDCYLTLFGRWEFFFFNATGLQIGPSQVLLFLIFPFFKVTFLQHVIPVDKFLQKVYHNCYANSFLPYWITALFLRLEVQQVLNDTTIWNKKTFGAKLGYNMKNEADKFLMKWRNWYAQFYDGGKEFQENLEKLGCPPPFPQNPHQENYSDQDNSSYHTFNNQNEIFHSVMSEHTVKRAKSNLSNSYHSFDYIEFGYEASFTKEADENKVLNVSKSDDLTDLCYENNKFCMKPKIDKNDDSSRTCFCFKTNRKNNKNDNKCKNLKDSERNFKSEKLQTYQKEKTNEITEKNECSLI